MDRYALATKCEHTDRRHEARGLCKSCYTTTRRRELYPPTFVAREPGTCPHPNRPRFGRYDLCRPCYEYDRRRGTLPSREGYTPVPEVIEEMQTFGFTFEEAIQKFGVKERTLYDALMREGLGRLTGRERYDVNF